MKMSSVILFFGDHCSLISNGSDLLTELSLRTDSILSSFNFTKDEIVQIITNLDPNKAHGYDKISILVLKICGDLICRPLNNLFFKTCFHQGKFPL